MKIEIKNRFSEKTILCGDYESMKDCLEKNSSADLSYTDLHSADLRSADLHSANLRYANLRSADLSFANLRSANLSYASLSSANLRYANLRYANLRSADLRSADLSFTIIYGEKITKKPIQLYGLKYEVMILEKQIKIGCELHDAKDWGKFKDLRISKMSSDAVDWWKIHKPIILGLHEEHVKK